MNPTRGGTAINDTANVVIPTKITSTIKTPTLTPTLTPTTKTKTAVAALVTSATTTTTPSAEKMTMTTATTTVTTATTTAAAAAVESKITTTVPAKRRSPFPPLIVGVDLTAVVSSERRCLKKVSSSMTKEEAIQVLLEKNSTPFPFKLMIILDCGHEELDQIMSWRPDGRSFVVHCPTRLEDEVLRKVLKTSGQKYSSFERKLYRWGFKRTGDGERRHYYHKYFTRGEPFLCLRKFRHEPS